MIVIIIIVIITFFIIALPRHAPGKAPQGDKRGSMGSKNPPAYQSPCFSLLGMVLKLWFRSKTPFPLCHRLVGRCLETWDNKRNMCCYVSDLCSIKNAKNTSVSTAICVYVSQGN